MTRSFVLIHSLSDNRGAFTDDDIVMDHNRIEPQ